MITSLLYSRFERAGLRGGALMLGLFLTTILISFVMVCSASAQVSNDRARKMIAGQFGNDRRAFINFLVSEFTRSPESVKRQIVSEMVQALGPEEWRKIVSASEGAGGKSLLSRFGDEKGDFDGRIQEEARDPIQAWTGRSFQLIIVHVDNPLRKLTPEQAVAIFSGEILNWKEVGGNDRQVDPVIASDGWDIYQALFKRPPADHCTKVAFSSTILSKVARNRGAVGVITTSGNVQLGFVMSHSAVKVVPIQPPNPIELVREFEPPTTR
jgi:ABC-type phosphate transport system substrate-binding protein